MRPGFKVDFDLPGGDEDFRRVYPFGRSWVAIAALTAMTAVFLFPAIMAFNQAAASWASLNSLFDLVAALFISAWLLGWSVAPAIMIGIVLLMLFGREVLRARPGEVELYVGLPFIGLGAVYDVTRMRNLRLEKPPAKSGKSWRGTHFAFDYGNNSVAFGSRVREGGLAEIRSELHMATRSPIRNGEVRPEELAAKWNPKETEVVPLSGVVAQIGSPPVSLASPSTLVLIIANLVPVAGTIFLGWNLSDVMVLYWAESAVVGFFNLCKMVVIGRWGALLAGPFFVGHFGGFMAVHFLFLYMLFVKGPQQGGDVSGGDLAEVAKMFIALWPALLALFVSHAYSFFTNFIGRKEYRGRQLNQQMSEPYSRIVFMHLVLIFGGGLTLMLGEATPVLIIVIGLKVFFDIRAHIKQRN